MERGVTGFHQDEEGHWVAELECGHNQHVRHDPPWECRPWAVTAGLLKNRTVSASFPIWCPPVPSRKCAGGKRALTRPDRAEGTAPSRRGESLMFGELTKSATPF